MNTGMGHHMLCTRQLHRPRFSTRTPWLSFDELLLASLSALAGPKEQQTSEGKVEDDELDRKKLHCLNFELFALEIG